MFNHIKTFYEQKGQQADADAYDWCMFEARKPCGAGYALNMLLKHKFKCS